MSKSKEGSAGATHRAEMRHDFGSKKRALQAVAGTVASNLSGGCYADMFGFDIEDDLTEAQQERLAWAWNEVVRRLYEMGGKPGD